MRRRVVPLVAILLIGIVAPTSALAKAPSPTRPRSAGAGDLAKAPTLHRSTGAGDLRGGSLKAASGISSPYVADAMTTQQYHLSGSDGRSWQDIDPANLSITIHAPANASVILMGNADLWTVNGGYNQDLGIAVSGGVAPNLHYPTVAAQPEAWKESGGFNGTYSPNAAFVETVIDVSANVDYTVRLQWKTNKRDPGTIFAGAGPLANGTFSNTRLTAQLIPATWQVYTAESHHQYRIGPSDGQTFVPVDLVNLGFQFTSPTGGAAFFEANADLWTPVTGYNQDIGVLVNPFPNSTQLATWKESGGFGGTFSPNAAFAQGYFQIDPNTPYNVALAAKANIPDPHPIMIGAGPIGNAYSPTTLTVIVMPNSVGGQSLDFGGLRLDNSDGATWQPMDAATVLVGGGRSTVDCVMILGANSDLWTVSNGYNQDLAIVQVTGTGPNDQQVLAWKESGGFSGAFSPNAAYVEAVVQISANVQYNFALRWKQNKAGVNSIHAGAGPWPKAPAHGEYSPTGFSSKSFGCS